MASKMKDKTLNPFKIRVGKRFFLSSSTLFGDIYFEFKDEFFPEKNWNDFIIDILIMWILALKKLTNQKQTTFHYMDGSFKVIIHCDKEHLCEIKFIEEGDGGKTVILKSVLTSLEYIFDEVISACETLFKALQNPENPKRLLNSSEIEDIDPRELLNEIKKTPHTYQEFEKLKDSYKMLCQHRKKLSSSTLH